MDSILNSIKKLLGIEPDNVSFDTDVSIHINSTFMKLNSLGVGPKEGYYIEDSSAVWTDYVSDRFIVEAIKTYVYIKVRLIFDPPQNTAVIESMKQSAEEYEYAIREWAEEKASLI